MIDMGDFELGDRVRVVGKPHMDGQGVGTIREIYKGVAFGIVFDGMEKVGIHRWYVDRELQHEVDDGEKAAADRVTKDPKRKAHAVRAMRNHRAMNG